MKNVIIYTKDYCPYCVKAMQLLKMKNVSNIQEIDITNDTNLQEEMLAKANGRRTVPQIFIGDTHVGGCDDLYALNEKGELDKLLSSA
ncbi:MAG: glutaredoxin 3 [Sphingobacteriia bacterium]|nr:glutaredoxin 3 [Sphingobacteriia bacterium]